MASVDERVVAMSFENAKFEIGVAKTMATLTKLDATIANIGKVNGLDKIEQSANKVTLTGPMSALDKLKSRLSTVGSGATSGFNTISSAASKLSFLNPLNAIDRLRGKLATVSSGASFTGIEQSANRVRFTGLNSALDSVKAKFGALQAVGLGALASIGSQASQKVTAGLKSISLGPVIDGLQEYGTQLTSIQTILANTQAQGTNLNDVNGALNQLNKYSDQTIYNFGQMAKNIGTFTAAGVDLNTSVQSIKGIANLAALSGSNADQASTAMYQLSQAIASGKVGLQDWNSVVNAGMGGAVFQKALANTGQAMGTLKKGAVQSVGPMHKLAIDGTSFRDSIHSAPGKKSWLTSEVLTNTLKQFTGDVTKAELKAQGFNDTQIKAIQTQGIAAKKAATQVKTLGAVFGVAKEAIGSGWAATFQVIFGNFGEAKKTFTDLATSLQGVIGKSAAARNHILDDWKKLGGRTMAIEGIKGAFRALLSFLKPIHDAFREIFPRATGKQLYDLTVNFRNFMQQLTLGPEKANNLKRTFAGVFALFHIGITVVKGIIGVIAHLLGIAGKGSGGFLAITGSLGDFIVAIDKAISKGHGLQGIFTALGKVLQAPIRLISAVGNAIRGLFTGVHPKSGQQLASSLAAVEKQLGPLGTALKAVIKVWQQFFKVLGKIANFIQPILQDVAHVFSQIGDAVMKGLQNIDYNKVMQAIQTVFIGGLAVGVKKLLGGIGVDLTGGLSKKIGKTLNTLQTSLVSIQKAVNAGTILLIAAAVLSLAGAAIIFAKIDPKALGKAMGAIAISIGQLVGAMLLMQKVGTTGFGQLVIMATSMLILAAAIDVLSLAVFAFSKISWEGLAKGLVGVAGSLVAIGLGMKTIGPRILLVGPGLLAVAGAMTVLAVAMKIMGSMKWSEVAKGLIVLGGSLFAISVAVDLMGPSLLAIGPGLTAFAFGLILLSGALTSFGSMDLVTMAKGLGGIAASLALITVAVAVLPVGGEMALQAASLLLLSAALTGIGIAVATMGSLGLATIAKGLIGIGAALFIFAVGLDIMGGTLAGSAALLAAAVALALLTPVLAALGSLSWGTLLKGLGAIALTLGVIGVAGLVAAPAIATIGAALIVLGAGAVLVASAFYILAKAFHQIGDEGVKGVGVMIAAVTAFIALLPNMVIQFVKGLVDILKSLATLAPQIVKSMVSIITTMINGMITLLPKAVQFVGHLLGSLLALINTYGIPFINAGIRLFLGFLNGVANNIVPITTAVAKIIGGFMLALAVQMPRIIGAGARLLISFLNGMASQLPRILASGAHMIGVFLIGVASHVGGIVHHAATLITNFLNAIANNLPRMIRAGARVIVGFINGVANNLGRVIHAGANLIIAFIRGVSNELPRIIDAGFKAIIHFLHGVAKAIRDNDDALISAGADILHALVDGIAKAAGKAGGLIKKAIIGLFSMLPHWAKKILGIHSPSKVFVEIGQQTMLGMAVGLQKGGQDANQSIERVAKDVIDTANNSMGKMPSLLEGLTNTDPVITPVLDLSAIKKDAKTLSDMTDIASVPVVPIVAGLSADQAAAISTDAQSAQAAQAPGPSFSFTQTNTSPEALSTVEIYRRTNNLLSQVKREIGATP